MPTDPPNWSDIEVSLRSSSRQDLARFLARSAARVVPLLAKAEASFGIEAIEWQHALASAVRVVEAFGEGREVSKFTLDIAAELARLVPAARVARGRSGAPNQSRESVEELEMVCASVAFSVDALRAASDDRAVRAAMQAVSNADAACLEVAPLLTFDAKLLAAGIAGEFGELWPTGEPAWFREGTDRLQELAPKLPRFLELGDVSR